MFRLATRPIGVTCLLLAALSCAPEDTSALWEVQLSGQAMGTTYSVKLISTSPVSEQETELWSGLISDRLEEVNQLMSTYLDSSEIQTLNRSPIGERVPLSPPTLEVLKLSRRLSDESDGAFDITVGPAVDAWGFGAEIMDTPPSATEIIELQNRIDYRGIDLGEGQATRLANVEANLSAVAKGYAVDRVAIALNEIGITSYLIEVGGEVRVKGTNSNEAPWRVAIEEPEARPGAIHRTIELTEGCLATSGDYRNSYEWEGDRYSHTLDPRTAAPVTHRLASVSVLHSRCAEADGYATVLMVLGPEDGLRFAQKRNLASLFLVYNGESGTDESLSPAFANRFELPNPSSAPKPHTSLRSAQSLQTLSATNSVGPSAGSTLWNSSSSLSPRSVL